MTPDEAHALDDDTYRAFAGYQREELRARERAARTKRR
jgi:hypothetical protein